MAGPAATAAFQVQDGVGVRATTALGPNFQSSGQQGRLVTQADTLLFPGPSITGNWALASQRVLAHNVPVVSQSSVGLATNPMGTTPMLVVQPDPRIGQMF